MFEVAGLAPLYPGIENGEPFTKIMPSLGLYADRNFLYYGNEGIATAYYEQADIDEAGPFTFNRFSNRRNFTAFLEGSKSAISDIVGFLQHLNGTDIKSLTLPDILELVLTNCRLEANIWSYYNATQPQHLAVFEQKLKSAIERSVANPSEVTDVFSGLAAYPELSVIEQEHRDWLLLLNSGKKSPANRSVEHLLEQHFSKYKTLQLGDGNWEPDIKHFRKQLDSDSSLAESEIAKQLKELEVKPKIVQSNKANLIRRLRLTDQEIYYADVLSAVGHMRLAMRSEGFIPLAYGEGKPIMDVLAGYYNTTSSVLRCLTYQELLDLENNTGSISRAKQRLGQPYLLIVKDGTYTTVFGDEAESIFQKLVPQNVAQDVDIVTGNSAMNGVVVGTAVVYQWGSKLPAKLPDRPILITGQTRPQLMPLIRSCIGIVTDEGGLMSHAAIVARELKLPCVVGAKDATKIIHSGDRIELDADTGVVTIQQRSQSPHQAVTEPTLTESKQPDRLPPPSKTPKIQHLLLTFDEVKTDQRQLVGGKGNSLSAMHHGGLPVPPGFVVTTQAYRKLHGRALPESIKNELTKSFDALGANRVAVRSSAVAEDAPSSSWAGQFETVLNVTRDRLADAVQLCWDSASSEIVADYARQNGVAEEDLALGVVVQAMIDSEVAGVAFTKNPVTGNPDEIMIEACFGLGELLVQGMVTPDNFVFQRNPLELKNSRHYPQETYLTFEHGANAELPLSDPLATKLTPAQATRLAKLAIQVEDYFGTPQDIEWALYKDHFFIVQARPITT